VQRALRRLKSEPSLRYVLKSPLSANLG